jgi:NitT/TauT family transport system substrate-binding protein
MKIAVLCALIGAVLAAAGIAGPAAAAESIVFGLPGIPPVFLSVEPYVAQKEGLFKKYGVEVTLRPFDTGAAAARATASGDIDFTVSPTPVVINMVSNAGVPLLGIYGLENSDWLIASTDPAIKSCQDLASRAIGVDTPGGARSAALRQMLVPCGLKVQALNQVGLSSNVGAALIAGQLKVGVLHLDDLAVIEEKLGRKLAIITTMKQVKPIGHYNLFAARADRLAARRDAYVRVVAGLIDAGSFMRDPKNRDRVAEIATVTGRSPAEAKDALGKYLDLEFWPDGTDGLDPKKVEAEIKEQVAVGAIQPGKTPVTYDKLVDRSVWQDAVALTRAAH